MKIKKQKKFLTLLLSAVMLLALLPTTLMAKNQNPETLSSIEAETSEDEKVIEELTEEKSSIENTPTESSIAKNETPAEANSNVASSDNNSIPFAIGSVFRTNIMIGGNPVLCAFTILTEGSGNNTVEIGWTGGGGQAVASSAAIGDLVIPPTIVNPNNMQTYAVVGIGDSAFQNCMYLTSTGLNTNNTVTYLGSQAFMWCSNLTETGLATNTTVKTVGSQAFGICQSLLSTGLDVNTTVTELGSWAFSNGTSLKETGLATNTTLTSTGDYTFAACNALESTGLASNTTIKKIGDGTFLSCPKLTSTGLEHNSSVTAMGFDAFWDCTNLLTTGLENPSSGVITIGAQAFKECPKLTSTGFETNASVTTLGEQVFAQCQGLTSTGLTTNTTLTALSRGLFWLCSGLTTTGLESNTTLVDVSDSAFQNCTGLVSSGLESNTTVTTIGSAAFYRCTALTGDLVIGNQVISVAEWAFRGSGYECVYLLQDTQPTIGDDAFLFNGGPGTLYVPETWTEGSSVIVGGYSYDNITGNLIYMYSPKITNITHTRTATNAATVTFDLDIPGAFNSNHLRQEGRSTAQLLPGTNTTSYTNITDKALTIPYEISTFYGLTAKWYNTALSKGIFPIDAWPYQLTVTAQTGGQVNTDTNSGSYAAEDTVNVSAIADTGYHFTGWDADGITVENAEAITFQMPSNDVTLIAQFEKTSDGNKNDNNSSNNNSGGKKIANGIGKNLPKTGHTSVLWITLMLSGATLIGIGFLKNKKKQNKA